MRSASEPYNEASVEAHVLFVDVHRFHHLWHERKDAKETDWVYKARYAQDKDLAHRQWLVIIFAGLRDAVRTLRFSIVYIPFFGLFDDFALIDLVGRILSCRRKQRCSFIAPRSSLVSSIRDCHADGGI